MFNRIVSRLAGRRTIPTRTTTPSNINVPSTSTSHLSYAEQKYDLHTRKNIAWKYDDLWDKHKTRLTLPGRSIAYPLQEDNTMKVLWQPNAFIAPSATLVGAMEIWDDASIWYNVIIKADVNLVRIGAYVNVQDNTVIHEALAPLSLDHDGSTIIGHFSTIGHGCLLKACTIEEECLVGMGSILNEGSYMETHSMLGAGSVLERGARVPTGELWVGNPAKFLRMLTEDEIEHIKISAEKYAEVAKEHMDEFYLPYGQQYLEAEKAGYPIGWTEDFWGKKYPKTYTGPKQ